MAREDEEEDEGEGRVSLQGHSLLRSLSDEQSLEDRHGDGKTSAAGDGAGWWK